MAPAKNGKGNVSLEEINSFPPSNNKMDHTFNLCSHYLLVSHIWGYSYSQYFMTRFQEQQHWKISSDNLTAIMELLATFNNNFGKEFMLRNSRKFLETPTNDSRNFLEFGPDSRNFLESWAADSRFISPARAKHLRHLRTRVQADNFV